MGTHGSNNLSPTETPPTTAAQSDIAIALADSVKLTAYEIGFDLVGIAPAISPATLSYFQEWLRQGFAGEMHYLQTRREAYDHPENVMQSVRSVIMLGINYYQKDDLTHESSTGTISRYSRNQTDYHRIIRNKLKPLADHLHKQQPGCRTRGIVDTAPLLERDFARLAGLGWFGKNTMLINKRRGSWLFLAALLTDVELQPDQPHNSAHCGTCTRCLDACPTDAFPEPYVLDASKCVSYLTIELRDQPVPHDLRTGIGDWLFGCDVCQDVCPWNRKAPEASDPAFAIDPQIAKTNAIELLQMSAAEFDARYGKTPLARPGRKGMLRNAAIVLGNAGDPAAIAVLHAALKNSEPLIRGSAAWALGQLKQSASISVLHAQLQSEPDTDIKLEIAQALQMIEERQSMT